MDTDFWLLDPRVTFLNHGSFGACPRPVVEAQAKMRERLERQPVQFFLRDLEPMLDEARAKLGAFVGADPESIAFVPNATTAVNSVVRSLDFAPGDELLATDHTYNSCKNALEFVAARSGAKVVVAKLPFPFASPDEVLAAIEARVTDKTKLALVDHVTSPTGLVLPIERIVRSLEERGVDALVDGAHAPGMVPLDLRALGAAYYTGNLHKWVCGPKGAAFLSTREDRRARVRPTVISHGANAPACGRSRYLLEFDWMGTDDPTAYLAVPVALEALASLSPKGWPGLMEENRAKALLARAILCQALRVQPPAPESMIGSLAAVPLPEPKRAMPAYDPHDRAPDPLYEELVRRGFEVPTFPWAKPIGRLVRVSAQRYNSAAQYEALARALLEILG